MQGVSFIISTLNAQRTLYECLERISIQDYPHSKFEILILDGGSSDKTINIANQFSHKIPITIVPAGFKDNMEARRIVGFKKAKFDLVCILDSDNYIGGRDWVSRLVEPMVKHPEIVGSFTLHYHYDPSQTLFNRYVSFFGGHDPVSYYLGKTDRLKWTDKTWSRQRQILADHKNYTLIKFTQKDFPTLGSNGSILRKKFINIAKLTPQSFFHTDILYDLVNKGKTTYSVVDVPLIHDTSSTLSQNIKKRIEYMSLHHQKLAHLRRYKVFNSASVSDNINLAKFCIYTLTLIEPLSEALIGYIKVPDLAWFIHPLVCWQFLFGYTYSIIKDKLSYR